MTEPIVKYCIRCGAELASQPKFGAERPVCSRCGWIYFADPKVAAVGLVEQEGKVLLVKRTNDPQKGFWSLPAGFVDAGEDPARAAERECLEETGLVVRATGLLDVIPGTGQEHTADIIIVYRLEITGGSLAAGDDADDAAFFPRDDLPQLAFISTLRAVGIEEKNC
jgi:8-oxo-dGTP diphosphatase